MFFSKCSEDASNFSMSGTSDLVLFPVLLPLFRMTFFANRFTTSGLEVRCDGDWLVGNTSEIAAVSIVLDVTFFFKE